MAAMTQSPSESVWSERLALSIAKEVRRHRQAQGLSAQQLSDRCAELGMPVQRSVLANLESGRRSTVTVAEVLVIAAALRIAPAQLVFPVGYVERVEALPDREMRPMAALDWLAGGSDLMLPGRNSQSELTPIRANRLHDSIVKSLHRQLRERSEARVRLMEAGDKREELREQRETLKVKIRGLETEQAKRASEYWNVPMADRPTLTDDEVERREELKRLRAQERLISSALAETSFLRERITSADKVIDRLANHLRQFRGEMDEQGWLLPRLPDDLYEFVHQPSQDVLDLELKGDEEPLW